MMPFFFLATLKILIAISLLFLGGELFVQGAVAIAFLLGIPQLVIGLTVVSLGTSAPELFVSIGSFFRGSDSLAISNVVGSNIFNVMVVLGSSAMILPLKVESRLIRRDVPLLLAISAAVWGMASAGKVTWQSGLALLIALVINTIWEIRTSKEEPEAIEKAEPNIKVKSTSEKLPRSIIFLLVGIILLSFGSSLLVNAAKSIALSLSISEAIIGLTIVSVGTSLPELTTSLVAAMRGKTDLAIGNVIGSCLLNQMLVLGTCSFIAGNQGLYVENLLIEKDFPIMVLTTFACIPIFWTKGRISRIEGSLLLGLYFLYLTDQILSITSSPSQVILRSLIAIIIPLVIIIIGYKSYSYWNTNRIFSK